MAEPKAKAPVSGIIDLVKANANARKTARALAEKRDACIAEMLEAYVAVYGPSKAPTIRRFLRDIIDGKPIAGQKPKPIRMMPQGANNGKTAAA